MRRFFVVAVAVVLAFGAPLAHAQVLISSTFSTSAVVPTTCDISTAPSAMAFGNYSGAALDASSTLGVTCASGVSFRVYLTTASGVRGLTATPGGPVLNYELYTDAGRTAVFPSTAGGATAVTSTGAAVTVSIFGRVGAGQTVVPSTYTQTVTANVAF